MIKSSKSIKVIQYILKKKKPKDLYFIVGSDILLKFHRWHSWKRIVKLTKLIVFSRKGYDRKSKKTIVVKYLNKNKDKNENVIWEVYRYDPNGIFQSGVDEYFKEIYFKPYTNLVYKGLIWEKIKELQTKGNIPDMKLGGNPSGTCALLSCYLVILSILIPSKTEKFIRGFVQGAAQLPKEEDNGIQ